MSIEKQNKKHNTALKMQEFGNYNVYMKWLK